MSSDSRDSALQDLWSIILSKVTGNEAPTEWSHACDAARGEQLLVARSRLSSAQAHTRVKLGISSRSLKPLGKYLGLGKGAVAGYLDLDHAAATRKESENEMLPMYAAESLLRLLELEGLAKQTFETLEEGCASHIQCVTASRLGNASNLASKHNASRTFSWPSCTVLSFEGYLASTATRGKILIYGDSRLSDDELEAKAREWRRAALRGSKEARGTCTCAGG